MAEDLDAYTGKWIVDLPRSVDYNHSGFCDPVITGLVGLRPRSDDTVEVNPLVPAGKWDWFCLDGVPYHGRSLTILYDKTGDRYHRGKGLRVLADGKEIAAADDLRRVDRRPAGREPDRGHAAGRIRAETRRASRDRLAPATDRRRVGQVRAQPRPRRQPRHLLRRRRCSRKATPTACTSPGGRRRASPWSRARTASTGTSRSIVLGPNDKTDWEADVNRPVVVKNAATPITCGTPARPRATRGSATRPAPTARTGSAQSDKPVLSPDQPWEKVAVMCPHVIWDEHGEAVPDVVQRRRAVRAGRHRLRHQPRRPAAGRSARTTRSSPPTRPRAWEQHKVTACQVVRHGRLVFDVLHRLPRRGPRPDRHRPLADGITDWQRLPANPIISPGAGRLGRRRLLQAVRDLTTSGKRWLLWYNGRRGRVEQIGLATHEGEDLGF